jgi:hypothetical protein
MKKLAALPIFSLMLLVVGYSSALAEQQVPFSLTVPPYPGPHLRPHQKPQRFELPPDVTYTFDPRVSAQSFQPPMGAYNIPVPERGIPYEPYQAPQLAPQPDH